MPLSVVQQTKVFAEWLGETLYYLVRLDHPTFAEPVRFVSEQVAVTVGPDTYLPFPFDVTLPNERRDELSSASLRIANVGTFDHEGSPFTVGTLIRSLDPKDGPVIVDLDPRVSGDLLNPLYPTYGLQWRIAEITAEIVSGELEPRVFLSAGVQKRGRRTTPDVTPGVFDPPEELRP